MGNLGLLHYILILTLLWLSILFSFCMLLCYWLTIWTFLKNQSSRISKEKWDSSGANEAMSRFSASIPDSTKNYISQTTGQLFSKEKLRPVSVCFGIGEERAFYVEKNPVLLIARIKQNVQFFYLNYLFMLAVIFGLTLFVSPSAIIGIVLLAGAWPAWWRT